MIYSSFCTNPIEYNNRSLPEYKKRTGQVHLFD
uniref:Uncharacterized protein n=1 Tax=Arundo donax TaxID=35708 RepID=A0A0A8ZZC4_ARUDO